MPKSKSPESSSPAVRVVLVEDDPVYRQFVRQVLKKVDGVELIAECSTGAEGIELCRRERPEALLLDLVLPDQQGVEVVKTLRGLDGKVIGIDRFGLSAPGSTVFKELGITTEAVVAAAQSL